MFESNWAYVTTMLQVNRGVAPNLFVCVVYIAPVGSKHEIESLFQNLEVDIVEVQTLGGIVLLGGDFNVRIVVLPNTIDTSDLCELLQAPELTKTKQPSVVTKWQNRDVSVGDWGCELLDLCYDTKLLILNGRTPSDESREFTCLANGARNTINYIVGSPAIWQVITHLEVIINDTRCYTMGGRLWPQAVAPMVEHRFYLCWTTTYSCNKKIPA
jgi:hypothetical protein